MTSQLWRSELVRLGQPTQFPWWHDELVKYITRSVVNQWGRGFLCSLQIRSLLLLLLYRYITLLTCRTGILLYSPVVQVYYFTHLSYRYITLLTCRTSILLYSPAVPWVRILCPFSSSGICCTYWGCGGALAFPNPNTISLYHKLLLSVPLSVLSLHRSMPYSSYINPRLSLSGPVWMIWSWFSVTTVCVHVIV